VVRQMTRLEFYEGVMLGVIGGIALLFQMDGVNYTDASTSAFLTQSYCILIPIWVICRKRRWPPKMVVVSTLMVLGGIAILSEINFRSFHIGRGEWETLLASVGFTAQILWLERPIFARNSPHNFSIVMFVVTALIFVPMPFFTGNAHQIAMVYSSPWPWVFSFLLALFCTTIAYTIMNYWQPHVEATQAGLIYCAEPVFTSIFALFLPGWFSAWAGIDYSNEAITSKQLLGGGLITLANVLIVIQAAKASADRSCVADQPQRTEGI
jgi:drug/metabolite transporter (DMT)-like permease